jgi:hypothetical protein
LVKVADILNEANLCKFKNLGTLKNKLDKQGNITGDKQFTNSEQTFTGVRDGYLKGRGVVNGMIVM